MTQDEIVAAVANRTGATKDEVRKILSVAFRLIVEAAAAGRVVRWRGFGAWRTSVRPERWALNPRTGQKVRAPARRVVAFRPGNWFRTSLKA